MAHKTQPTPASLHAANSRLLGEESNKTCLKVQPPNLATYKLCVRSAIAVAQLLTSLSIQTSLITIRIHKIICQLFLKHIPLHNKIAVTSQKQLLCFANWFKCLDHYHTVSSDDLQKHNDLNRKPDKWIERDKRWYTGKKKEWIRERGSKVMNFKNK